MSKILFALIFILSSNLSFADWKYMTLTSAEGVRIQIDYEVREEPAACYKCNKYTYATPLRINVKHPSLSSSDKVRVVILNFRTHAYVPGVRMESQEVDMQFWDENFSREVSALPIYSSGYGGIAEYRQQIAVVINGYWLKNPINQSSNFDFKL